MNVHTQKESKALIEVRNWKKTVAKETENLKGTALLNYYNERTKGYKRKKAA